MTGGRACLITGVLGLVAMGLIGLAFGAAPLLRGWLVAVLAVLGVPLGALLLLLVDHLVPKGWPHPMAAALEASALTTPLVGLGLAPLLAVPALVWPWAGAPTWPPEWPDPDWLRPGAFAIRAVLYLALWSVLAVLAATRTRGLARPGLAASGLVALTLAGSLAAFDWGMSLEPTFRSTIYGLMILTDLTLTGFAFAVPLALLPPARQPAAPGPMAAVLLSLVMLWAYLAFCQYLIVWSGDLPREVAWYLRRVAGGWQAVAWALGLAGTAIFLALLPARVRHSARAVAAVALAVLALRVAETAWLFIPAWPEAQGAVGASFAAGLAAGGGLWGWAFLGLLARRPAAESAHG